MRIQALMSDASTDQYDLASQFDVTSATVDKWMKSQKFPEQVRIFLQLNGGHYPGWEGFKIRPGEITLPNGEVLNQDQIQSYYDVRGSLHTEIQHSAAMREKAYQGEQAIRQKLYERSEEIISDLLDHLKPDYLEIGEGRSERDSGERPTDTEEGIRRLAIDGEALD